MEKEKILVLGACGQIGVELTLALRKKFGGEEVIAADLREEHLLLRGTGPYTRLDVLNKEMLQAVVIKHGITQVYLLAAMLSATAEKKPVDAWNLNTKSLLNLLEIARSEKIKKIFWPSSIAVFGPSSPKRYCPQHTVMEPETVYGVSKLAGEGWCHWYHEKFGIDVRSLRYPGLISYTAAPGGGTTDYAVQIFYDALTRKRHTCFLKPETYLPMMYMPDAIRATIELMEVPAAKIRTRTSYNLGAMSFSPARIAEEIKKHVPGFVIDYQPDVRQSIADSWPQSINDHEARWDWGWKAEYDLASMTADMLVQIRRRNISEAQLTTKPAISFAP